MAGRWSDGLSPAAAQVGLQLAALYGAAGFGVGVAFLVFGLERCTPAARGAYAFRLLLLPGLMLLWPLVLWRWAVLAREG
jgi:hypothetical protein